MGGWDYYCAICGGPLYRPQWDTDPDPDNTFQYNPTVLTDQDDPELAWLEDCRLIGENPEADTESNVWLSGPATYEMYGGMEFEAGETPDPSLPEDQNITVYCWDGDYPFSAPFHTRCREVLCRYIGVPELDKELFFETIKGLAVDNDGATCLNIDYGDINSEMEQYWATQIDAEYFVCNPVEVRGLERFYEYLPSRDTEAPVEETRIYSTDGDPFAKLSPDILILLMSHVTDMTTLHQLRKASPAFANIGLSNGFWRKRIQDDMLWLWDFSALTSSQLHGSVDWKRVYRRLDLRTQHSSKPDEIFHGLCNRRRIYEQMCPQLAALYNRLLANRSKWGTTQAPILQGAGEITRKELGGYEFCTPRTQTLIDDFSDLPNASPCIVEDWDEAGYLIDVHILQSPTGLLNRSEKTKDKVHRFDIIEIPDGDWLAGLVFTLRTEKIEDRPAFSYIVGLDILFAKGLPVQKGSSEGDKRILCSSDDAFVVAIKTFYSKQGYLSGLAMFEQGNTRVGGHRRIIKEGDSNSSSLMEYVWAKELPPWHVRLSDYKAAHGIGKDRSGPVELLILGYTEEELADIVSISADIRFGGIEINYSHRPSRRIGPSFQATKTLLVDGQGGERIVQVSATCGHSMDSLTFLTNRGRSLLIGNNIGNEIDDLKFIQAIDNEANLILCGVYVGWLRTDDDKFFIQGVGTVGSVELGYQETDELPRMPVDGKGRHWEPEGLPPSHQEYGTVWGAREIASGGGVGRAREVPSKRCIITSIDCSRAISEVRVSLVHSSYEPILAPITAIKFKYADGEEAVVGPGTFSENPTCGCMFQSRIDEELEQAPHYRHETWEVEGKKLTSLKVWLTGVKSLGAIQFIAEGQTESPVWGFWGHDTTMMQQGEIRFAGEGGGNATGLKVFSQGLGRGWNDDTVTFAVQAVGPKTFSLRSMLLPWS